MAFEANGCKFDPCRGCSGSIAQSGRVPGCRLGVIETLGVQIPLDPLWRVNRPVGVGLVLKTSETFGLGVRVLRSPLGGLV